VLTRRTALLVGGEALAFIDIDSTQKRMFGPAKQGAAFGHRPIRALRALSLAWIRLTPYALRSGGTAEPLL
jgi:hypothetical protein